MIKNIIFDNGGVFVEDSWLLYQERLKELYGNQYEEIISQVYPVTREAVVGKMSFQSFKEKLAELVRNPEEIPQFLIPRSVDREMADYALKLKSDYHLILLTNDISSFRADNQVWHLENIFGDDMFCSSEMGVAKPSPGAFEYVLKSKNLQPSECLFVDDKERNVLVAQQLGIYGIVFSSKEQFESDLNSLVESQNNEK